jgi:hypothetical protein
MIYALARPEDLGWWQVFGLTIRNSVVVAPTIVFLLWPVVRPHTVIVSMVAGLAAGLGWNAATGFSPSVFLLGINPMWVGTGGAFLVMMVGTLVFPDVPLILSSHVGRRFAGSALALAGTLLLLLGVTAPGLVLPGLRGPDLFTGILAWFFGLVIAVEGGVRRAEEDRLQAGVSAQVD